MTVVNERNSARAFSAVHRLAAITVLLVVAACFSGANTNAPTLTGVIGPGGNGGDSNSSGGAPYAGTYTLQDVNDSVLPVQLAYDSVTGADTMRVFQAWIDSSIMSLNDDSTADEMDYLEIRDVRSAADSSFNREVSFGDTLTGEYSATSTTITVNLTDTVSGIVNVTYNLGGDGTFSGVVPYELYNTDNQLAATGSATYNYVYSGPPTNTSAVPGRIKVIQGRRIGALLKPSAVGSRVESRTTAVSGVGARSSLRQLRVPAWALARLLSSGTPPARTRP
jgi:hypothetical protein